MSLKVIGKTKDYRTSTAVVYAQVNIQDYLRLIGDNFDDFEIQRRQVRHAAYGRMKKDIVKGALLPPITLAAQLDYVDVLKIAYEDSNLSVLENKLAEPGKFNILDGLQRTFILKDLQKSGVVFNDEQRILVEFWIEGNISNLIYRIIVLNAGQKPMSIRHQIEILFGTLKPSIESRVQGLELYTERETARRRSAGKFALDKVASAYQAFIMSNPDVEKENIVAQGLIESDVLSSEEEELNKQFEDFIKFLIIYKELDDHICRIYSAPIEEKKIPTGASWFGNENVMNAFFSAISQLLKNEKFRGRIETALSKIKSNLASVQTGEDPMGLEVLQELIEGFNVRKVNVGFATRKLLNNGFKEYLRAEGDILFSECWKLSAE